EEDRNGNDKSRDDHGQGGLAQAKFGDHIIGNGLGASRGLEYAAEYGAQADHGGHKPQGSAHSVLYRGHDLPGIQAGEPAHGDAADQEGDKGVDAQFEDQKKDKGDAGKNGKQELDFGHLSCFRISWTSSAGGLSIWTVRASPGGSRVSNWDCRRSRGMKWP